MTTIKELRDWLATFADDEQIAVDDGGLTLVVFPADFEGTRDGDPEGLPGYPYFEIGGIPTLEEDSQ